MQKKGFMIVFDGSNGAGKSTVLQLVAGQLTERGHDLVITREPGGTRLGEQIRAILLDPESSEMCAETELLLFAAARAQHVREKILPAIERGSIVLSDRFDAATVSFQHYARGLPRSLIDTLNAIALNGFQADLTLIFDIDPVLGLQRTSVRGGADRLEKENKLFLQKARQGYLAQAQEAPERFCVIDASLPLDDVVRYTMEAIDNVLDKAAP